MVDKGRRNSASLWFLCHTKVWWPGVNSRKKTLRRIVKFVKQSVKTCQVCFRRVFERVTGKNSIIILWDLIRTLAYLYHHLIKVPNRPPRDQFSHPPAKIERTGFHRKSSSYPPRRTSSDSSKLGYFRHVFLLPRPFPIKLDFSKLQ